MVPQLPVISFFQNSTIQSFCVPAAAGWVPSRTVYPVQFVIQYSIHCFCIRKHSFFSRVVHEVVVVLSDKTLQIPHGCVGHAVL